MILIHILDNQYLANLKIPSFSVWKKLSKSLFRWLFESTQNSSLGSISRGHIRAWYPLLGVMGVHSPYFTHDLWACSVHCKRRCHVSILIRNWPKVVGKIVIFTNIIFTNINFTIECDVITQIGWHIFALVAMEYEGRSIVGYVCWR